jgi:DNA-binding transcriptional regulator YiaG
MNRKKNFKPSRRVSGDKERMTTKGREIVDSLTEAVEVERGGISVGSRFTVSVRATRQKLAVSQAIFAHLLGVSAMLVRAWEQGQRAPAMWARRLLDEVNRDPRHWRGMLQKAS